MDGEVMKAAKKVGFKILRPVIRFLPDWVVKLELTEL